MRKVCGYLFSFFALLTAILGGLFINLNYVSSYAFTTSTAAKAARVGELWDDTEKRFNEDNLTKLLQYVTGDNTVTTTKFSEVRNQARTKKTAKEISEQELYSTVDYETKNAGEDIIVTLGGLDWTVTYLSTDVNGNPILTLWLAYTEQLNGKNFYSAVGNTTTKSSFGSSVQTNWMAFHVDNNNNNSATPASTYPDNMYGTSSVRAVVLNNGGTYSSGHMGTSSMTVTKKTDSVFSPYTVTSTDGTAIADYITLPKDVPWQQKGQAAMTKEWYEYPCTNEDLETNVNPIEAGYYTTSDYTNNGYKANFNYTSRNGYDAWGNDCLWLPSVAEVTSSTDKMGIWNASTNQKSDFTASGYFLSYICLRSGKYDRADYIGHVYNASGISFTDSCYVRTKNNYGSHGEYLSTTILEHRMETFFIRPALHLNLASATRNAIGPTDINTCVVDEISNGQWNPVSNSTPALSIRDPASEITLIEGTDYTISVPAITKPDTYTITITGQGGYTGTTSVNYVIDKRNIETALRDNNLIIPNQIFTGGAVEPNLPTLKDYAYIDLSGGSPLSSEGIELILGTDYSISYSNNNAVGTATITIQGIGAKYTGTTTTAFTISPLSITGSKFTLSRPSVEYNFGQNLISAVVPNIEVNSKLLTLNTDYSIAYFNSSGSSEVTNISQIGTYIIRATGKGAYKGTAETTFTVTQHTLQPQYLTITGTSPIYNGTAQTIAIRVLASYGSGNTYSFIENSDYTVSYDNNLSASTSARVTIIGSGNFTGTVVKNFTISPKPINSGDIIISNISEEQYNGNSIVPSFTVTDSTLGTSLIMGIDFTATYSNNVNVSAGSSQATINISGIGNYGGNRTKPFIISARQISSATLQSISDQTYTGANIEPNLQLTDGSIILNKNVDYTAVFTNNINVGTAIVHIEGKGNYTGTKTSVFTIIKANLNSAGTKVVLNPSTSEYTGNSIIPDISVTTIPPGTAESVFVATSNYDISVVKDGITLAYGLNDIIGLGNYTILITGKNNYEGSAREIFTVTKCNIANLAVELSATEFVYNKSVQTPTESIILNGMTLQKGTDYDLEYRQSSVSGLTVLNPINANKYFIVITGKGNFEGNNTKLSFDITPAKLSGDVVSTFTTTGNNEISESAFQRLNYVFDNSAKEVNIKSVTINGIEFYSGTDFLDVVYLRDNKNTTDFTSAGTITIKISSLSDNVQGDKSYNYTIGRRNLSGNANIEITGLSDATYNRQPHNNHIVTIRDGGANNYLLTDNDYIISYPTDTTSANPSVKVSFIATSSGNYEGKAESTFAIAKATIDSFDISSSSGKYNAQPHTFSSVVMAGDIILNTTEYRLKYTRDGVETTDLTSVGIITITLTLPNISNFEISSFVMPKTYSISDIQIVSVTLAKTTQVFNNADNELIIASVMGDNNTILPASDYDINWKYNRNTNVNPDAFNKYYAKNVGTYSLTISGKGNVTGQATAEFTITTREITSSVITYYQVNSKDEYLIVDGNKVKVELETDYRGQRVKPEIIMNLGGANSSYELKMSADDNSTNPTGDFTFGVYEIGKDITPANNIFKSTNFISVGEYNFVIKGINNFAGTIQNIYRVNLAQFNETKIEIEISENKNLVYTGGSITFNFDEWDTSSGKGVGVQKGEIDVIYNDEKFGEGSIPAKLRLYKGKDFELFVGYLRVVLDESNQITSATIVSESEKDGENVIHVKDGYINNNSVGQAAFVLVGKEGSSFTTNEVIVHRFTISRLPITQENTIIDIEDSYEYTGSSVFNPADIVVTRLGKTLVYNKDYTISLSESINAGSVTLTIKGINTYENEFTKAFEITQKQIEDRMFTVSENKVYNGTKQTPTITGTFNGTTGMVLNTDYAVTYETSTGGTPDFIKAETITITIQGKGNFTGEITKSFTIEKQTIKEIVLSSSQATFTGAEHTFTWVVNDVLGKEVKKEEYSVAYSTEDKINAGTIRVSVVVESTSNYKVTTEVYANFVIAKASLNETTGTVDDVTYSGYVNRPNKDDIKLKLGMYSLDASEYEIENVLDSINVSTVETKATVILKATNKNFEGRKEIEFNVVAKNINEINAGTYQQTFGYNGQNQVPEFNLNYSSLLVVDRDYTMIVERQSGEFDADRTKSINVGTFNVIITGIGNFTGSMIKTYSISRRDLSGENTKVEITFEQANHVYTGEEINPTITKVEVTINGTKLTLTDADYSVAYTDCINAGNGTVTLTGLGNFTGSALKTFTIAPAQLNTNNLNIQIADKSYTGSRVYLNEEDIHIYNKQGSENGAEIDKDNYEISYIAPPINVGKYTITIRGKANYKGTIQAQFSIVPISLDLASISYVGGEDIFVTTYTGVDLRQTLIDNIIVTIGEVKLQHAVHFTISYSEENLAKNRYLIDVGTKDFTIVPRVGNNNVTGSMTSQFTVLPRSLDDCTLNLITKKYTYTGEDIEPEYEIKYNGIPLREGIDFSTEYNGDHKNCGNVTCTISAPTSVESGNNFEGSLSLDFTIEQAIPVVEPKDETQTFFAGDAISIESFGLKAYANEKEIEGTLRLTNTNTTLSLGENVIRYSFTPADLANYKTVNGSLRVYAVNFVRVTFTYNRGEVKDVIAGGNTRIDVRVELRRGTNYSLLTRGVDYKETITLVDTNEEVGNIQVAGRYEIVVEMQDPENFVIQNENNISFYAKSKTLYAKDAPFYAISKDYFEEGTELLVETYESKRDIVGIIGAENYDSISNIRKVYRVIGLFKGSEQQSLDGVSIYFETTTSDFYTYGEEGMSSAYHNRTNVEVEAGVFLIESQRESNVVTIIIIVAVIAVVLIVAIIVIVKVVNNRKYKKAMGSTKVDLEKLNQIANSASSARATGATPNVQTIIGQNASPQPRTPQQPYNQINQVQQQMPQQPIGQPQVGQQIPNNMAGIQQGQPRQVPPQQQMGNTQNMPPRPTQPNVQPPMQNGQITPNNGGNPPTGNV